jgi:hypothetical protein
MEPVGYTNSKRASFKPHAKPQIRELGVNIDYHDTYANCDEIKLKLLVNELGQNDRYFRQVCLIEDQ